ASFEGALKRPLVSRGRLCTLHGQFSQQTDWDDGLIHDLRVICEPDWGECWSGAASCAVHPFLCELPTRRRTLLAIHVLAALQVADFRSAHVVDLKTSVIPYPGYRPGTDNDEIHTEFASQYVFRPFEQEEGGVEAVSEFASGNGILKRHVAGGQLWYV